VISLHAIGNAWNLFFHAQEAAYTVALFRIVFGLLLLTNAALFVRDARLWIGPAGLFSHSSYCAVYGHTRFTVLRYLPPTDAWVFATLGVHVIGAALLTIGCATRWSAAVAFITLLSIHHRNPVLVYGGDDVLRLMGFLLIFSRAGAALSIDASFAARATVEPALGDAWCTRLMQLQVSFVYFAAFLNKLGGSSWIQGTAAFYAVEVADFRRHRLPRFARTLFWSRSGTWSILAFEFLLGPAIWIRELRYPVLAIGVAMHLAMDWFMNLQLFGATMIACLLLFVDPAVVAHVLRMLRLL
jgi:hypothetical protein